MHCTPCGVCGELSGPFIGFCKISQLLLLLCLKGKSQFGHFKPLEAVVVTKGEANMGILVRYMVGLISSSPKKWYGGMHSE